MYKIVFFLSILFLIGAGCGMGQDVVQQETLIRESSPQAAAVLKKQLAAKKVAKAPLSKVDTICTEEEYWEEISDAAPYPGMNCKSGPAKNIGVTFHIAKEIDKESYVRPGGMSAPEAAKIMLAQLNEAFSPHGIIFHKRDIFYAAIESPRLSELARGAPKEGLGDFYDRLMGDNYNPSDINFIFKPYNGFSCPSDLYDLAGGVGRPRCQSAPLRVQNTSMVHEVGHFFGLVHTFFPLGSHDEQHFGQGPAPSAQELFGIRGPHWTSPAQECHKTADYVCDTPFDCYRHCEQALGCAGLKECGAEYNPIITNIMSYYPGSRGGTFTKEQGARMRHFLMHRLGNNLGGNILQEYFK